MADLGNLFFGIHLKDMTDSDWDKIIKNIERKGAKLGLTVDADNLHKQINQALANRKYEIDLGIAMKDNQIEAAIRNAYERVSRTAGTNATASDVRQSRIDSNYMRADAYVKSQEALERNRNALAALREARLMDAEATRQQRAANEALGQSSIKVRSILGGLRNELVNVYSIYTLQNFMNNLIQIGGEFQKQHIALQTMLGDVSKADEIFSQMKQLAVESPFNFQNITGWAKQLTAYSIPYEELYDTTKRLADISAGLGVDMNRIILAYGQVRSAEFLRGTELRQFTEAGIPLLDQLAKKFTELEGRVVSVGEVFDKISAREVPFQMVKDVLWDLTNEGGQFFQMQEVLTESLSGKLDKLKDSYQIMLGDIAQANNDIIGGGLDVLTSLASHWESFLNVLYPVIAAWGTYRAIIALVNAADAVKVARTVGLTNALNANTIATLANARAQNGAAVGGLKLLNNLSKLKAAFSGIGSVAGGWGVLIPALVAVGTYAYNAYQEANRLRKELEEIDQKAIGNIEELSYRYQYLVRELGNAEEGTKEYADIIQRINSGYGQYLDHLFSEAEAYENVAKSIDKVTAAIVNKVQNQAYEQKVSTITGDYTEQLAEIQKDIADRIADVYGVDDKLAKTMAQRVADLIKQGRTYEEAMKIVSDDLGKTYKSLEKVRTFAGDPQSIAGNTSIRTNVGKEYEETFKEFKRMLEEASTDIPGYIPYAETLNEIKKKWDEINKSAKTEAGIRQNTIKMYEEQMSKLRDMGMPENDNIYKGLDRRKKALENLKDSWYEIAYAINDARKAAGKKGISPGNLPTLKQGEQEQNIAYFESLAKAAAQAKETIDKLSLVPKKNMTDANKSSLESAKAILEFVKKYEKQLGISIRAFGKTKKIRGEGQKDEFAEQMKERLSLIKDAYSEYEKWLKLVDKQEAIKKMQASPIFSVLFQDGDFDPSEYKKNIQDIIDRINKAGATTEERRGIVKDAEKLKFDIDGDYLKKQADKVLKEVKKYIEETTKKWDLYKQLFDATGNKEYSLRMAFTDVLVWDEAATSMRAELEKRMGEQGIHAKIDFTETEDEIRKLFGGNESELYKLYMAIKERIEKNGIDLKVNAANAMADAMSLEEKIRAKESQKEEALQPYTEGTQEYEAIAKQFDDEILKLRADLFELSPAFKRIFQDTTGMSIRQINELRKEAQSLLDLIDSTKSPNMNADGEIISYTYDKKDGSKGVISKETYDALIKLLGKIGEKANGVQIAFERMWAYINGDEYNGGKLSFLDIAKDLSTLAQEAGNAAGALGEMFSALGNEGLSDGFSFAGDMLGSVSSIASGIASGNPFAVIGGVAQGLTSIFQFHDKRLQRQIEESQRMVDEIQGIYDNVERALDRTLGDGHSIKLIDAENDRRELQRLEGELGRIKRTGSLQLLDLRNLQAYSQEAEKLRKRMEAYDEGGAYGYERQLLEEQYAELEKQMRLESEKKNSDESKLQDYKDQLAELRDQITYFAQDLADELYSIDLKGWSQELGDSLYDAWQHGEDGAEAFRKKAGELIGEVMNDILRMRILEPAMQDISDYLFGTEAERAANGGKGGVFGTDLKLDDNEMKGLADQLAGMADVNDAYMESMNALEPYLNELGLSMKDLNDEASGGLSAGIKNITEDTDDLLASYVNAIRNDVSVDRSLLEKFFGETFPGLNVIAQAQLTQLELIARNTERGADSSEEILNLLRKNVSGVNRFNV